MNERLRTMHLFAGAGGVILADLILGHQPIVAVEWEPYPCQVLRERVADGWFPDMHVWEGDVRLFDPSEYKGRVDCIHAGFPCQDISNAGNKAGVGEGTRSGLYTEVLRIADEIRPPYIFLENVAAITSKSKGYLEVIGKDLSEIGYDAVWTTLSAAEVGAKHKRDRWWLLAYPKHSASRQEIGRVDGEEKGCSTGKRKNNGNARKPVGASGNSGVFPNSISEQAVDEWGFGERERHPLGGHREATQREDRAAGDNRTDRCGEDVSDTNSKSAERLSGGTPQEHAEFRSAGEDASRASSADVGFWQVESEVGRVVDGMAHRAHQLKALGNGQVPLQAAAAFSILWELAYDVYLFDLGD